MGILLHQPLTIGLDEPMHLHGLGDHRADEDEIDRERHRRLRERALEIGALEQLAMVDDPPEGGETAKDGETDQFSQSLTGIGKMMLAGAIGDPKVLEASAKYEGQSVFVIATKGASLDIQGVAIAPAPSSDEKAKDVAKDSDEDD